MSKPIKTNVIRLLEQKGIAHELRFLEVDEAHHSAEESAQRLGIAPELLYKTLVLTATPGQLLVAVLPSNAQLNFKKLAQASGHKTLHLLPLKELRERTGYVRGGCSPIGMKRAWPTFIEELATLEEQIWVNAGARGCLVRLPVEALSMFTQAQFIDLCTLS